jgi:hypothetical protein
MNDCTLRATDLLVLLSGNAGQRRTLRRHISSRVAPKPDWEGLRGASRPSRSTDAACPSVNGPP